MSSLKKKSFSALVWDFGGLFLKTLGGFIISIILARILTPEEFGLIGMAMVFIAFSDVFIDVGFGTALIQNKNNSNLDYSSVFFFNLFIGIILFVLFLLLAPYVGEFYENKKIIEIVRWLSVSFIFSALNQVQTAILVKNLNFKALTIRNIISTLVSGILGIIAALNGFGVFSLVIQTVSNLAMNTLLLWGISTWRPQWHFSFQSLRKYIGFSGYIFTDTIISTIFNRLDVLLIGKLFSATTLGFYTRGVTLKNQVITLSTTSLNKVFFPVLSKLQDNESEYERIYFKVISVIALLAYGIAGVLYFWGEAIIINLYGIKWSKSVEIFQILILSVCNYPINLLIGNALKSKGLAKEKMKIGLLIKVFQLIPLIVAYFYGLKLFLICFVIISYFNTIVNIYLACTFIKISKRKHFRKSFESILPLVLFVLGFNYWEFHSMMMLINYSLTFLLIHALYAAIFKIEGLIFISHNVKEIWKSQLRNRFINKP